MICATDWDQQLPYVLFAYHISTHCHERNTLLSDAWQECMNAIGMDLVKLDEEGMSTSTYKQELVENLKKAYDDVRYLTSRVQQEKDQQLNNKKRPHSFKVGDLVWLYSYSMKKQTSQKKLGKPWKGPFRINTLLSPVTAKLYYMFRRLLKAVINVAQLKKYHSSTILPNNIPDLSVEEQLIKIDTEEGKEEEA
jgi:hypothetical protein